MVSAAGRVILPDLTSHPMLPWRNWVRPEERGNTNLPSRHELLLAALASDKLGDAVNWRGTSNDLFTIYPVDSPQRAALNGSPRWLEIGVRTNGSLASHTTLAPRQPLTATPYATMASSAAGYAAGKPNITHLAGEFGVSRKTILRDLHDLIQRGQLDESIYPEWKAERDA